MADADAATAAEKYRFDLAVERALLKDERVVAMEQIASHPFFTSCYQEEGPLLTAMLRRLDDAMNHNHKED